jgi:hypothetical protein
VDEINTQAPVHRSDLRRPTLNEIEYCRSVLVARTLPCLAPSAVFVGTGALPGGTARSFETALVRGSPAVARGRAVSLRTA